MQAVSRAALVSAFALAAAGCQVNVDENTAERIDNAASGLSNAAERAAAGAENVAEGAAARIDEAAGDLGNVNLDVDVGRGGNEARDGNAASGNGQ